MVLAINGDKLTPSMNSAVNGDLLKAKLEGLLQSTLAKEPNGNVTKLPAITLVNKDQSRVIEGAKLEFIQDPTLKQALKGRRKFGSNFRYLIFCSQELFEHFIEWINERPPPLRYQLSNYSTQFWIDHAVPAWFLARRLSAPDFEKYALSQFIQNCSLCSFGPWQLIQDEASKGSSLSQFSNYWIAWNHYLAGGRGGEFSGLDAANLARQVNGRTKDPRIYDIEHWYSPCGAEINPDSTCSHDPVRREERRSQQRKRKKKELMDWDEYERQSEMSVKEIRNRS